MFICKNPFLSAVVLPVTAGLNLVCIVLIRSMGRMLALEHIAALCSRMLKNNVVLVRILVECSLNCHKEDCFSPTSLMIYTTLCKMFVLLNSNPIMFLFKNHFKVLPLFPQNHRYAEGSRGLDF